MDTNRKIYRFLLSFILAPICLFAQPEKGEAAQSAPLRVLYVTGGGWHDYEGQTPIVKAIIKEALGEVEITVSVVGGFGRQNPDFNFHPAFKQEDWAGGFDLVVYNKCNSPGFSDDEWVERIVTPHRQGLPAVLIHGTLHNFWPDEKRTGLWNQFCGITSRNHEPRAPVTTTVADRNLLFGGASRQGVRVQRRSIANVGFKKIPPANPAYSLNRTADYGRTGLLRSRLACSLLTSSN